MNTEISYQYSITSKREYSKWMDYMMLIKLRLSVTVVFTSVLGYLILAGSDFSIQSILLLWAGGFLVTSAANAINQVLEKDFDRLMNRTRNRPLAAGRMKSSEAVLFSGFACILGILILGMFNPITATLGMLSFVTYTFVYTPLKRHTTASIAIGAIPGALPVLIGATAYEGKVSIFAIGLFIIQFLWQFPHFWAIGFLGYKDYKNAGFKLLLGNEEGIDRNIAMHCFVYTLIMNIPIIFIYYMDYVSLVSTIIALVATGLYSYFSIIMHRKFEEKSAKGLLYYSFVYMPIVLLTYLML